MCGIFGLIAKETSTLRPADAEAIIHRLLLLSESRGKEAAGLAAISGNTIQIYKQAIPASQLIRTQGYRDIMRHAMRERTEKSYAMIGHSRLVTNGAQNTSDNNQPVTAGQIVAIHNGIIVNDNSLWPKFPELHRNYDVDTEIFLCMIRLYYQQTKSLVRATQQAFAQAEGVINIIAFIEDFNQILLATNNGSLYVAGNRAGDAWIFASESYTLQMLGEKEHLTQHIGEYSVEQIAPGQGCLINLDDFTRQNFFLAAGQGNGLPIEKNGVRRTISELKEVIPSAHVISSLASTASRKTPSWLTEEYERNRDGVARLRRCKRCIHPETIPFVDIDESGLCYDCRTIPPQEFLGREKLEELLAPFRRKNKPDCLVPISGGRDSCYAIHYIKNELKMNPITYTYDWGMVTDLARRNISRMCAKLGVEHILVSADITKKREYIRKNVQAWLRRPDLGLIPLFMAGDKQFFYYADQVRKQTGIESIIFSMNPLERSDFKHNFTGVRGGGHDKKFFRLSLLKKLELAAYYGKSYLMNPGYLNSSLLDTVFAFFAYYMMPHEYIMLFDYIPWEEEPIEKILLGSYNWEISPDTRTTWRIGDGTASFYNYIYYTVAGFTENDTFRSNQIRQGVMTRERALELANEDNKPRYDSICWYCETIGIDPDETLRTINAIPKLYKVS